LCLSGSSGPIKRFRELVREEVFRGHDGAPIGLAKAAFAEAVAASAPGFEQIDLRVGSGSVDEYGLPNVATVSRGPSPGDDRANDMNAALRRLLDRHPLD
jgi:hypothetical protein